MGLGRRKAPGLGLIHPFLDGDEPFRAHGLQGRGIAVDESAQMVVVEGLAVNGDDDLRVAEYPRNPGVQVVQGVAVLREDDERALPPRGVAQPIAHVGLGLAGKLEAGAVAIEGTLGGGDLDRRLVVAREQALLDRAVGVAIDALDAALADGHHGRDGDALAGLDAAKGLPCLYLFACHADGARPVSELAHGATHRPGRLDEPWRTIPPRSEDVAPGGRPVSLRVAPRRPPTISPTLPWLGIMADGSGSVPRWGTEPPAGSQR
jgi:hypothetical protein